MNFNEIIGKRIYHSDNLRGIHLSDVRIYKAEETANGYLLKGLAGGRYLEEIEIPADSLKELLADGKSELTEYIGCWNQSHRTREWRIGNNKH